MEQPKETTIAQFYLKNVRNAEKSRLAGHEVCDDEPWVSLIKPGDNTYNHHAKVTEQHKQRWPRAWEFFVEGIIDEPIEGQPLKQWPQITPAQIEYLRHRQVKTVEQLAELPLHQAQGLGRGMQQLQQKAQTYLRSAAKDGTLSEEMQKLRDDNGTLTERIEDLQKVIESQTEQIEQLMEAGKKVRASEIEPSPADLQPKKRGRGRPRKKPAPAEPANLEPEIQL